MALLVRRTGSKRAVVTPIGLDIGPRCLRAAQLERLGDRWRVVRVTTWERRESEMGTTVIEGFAKRIRRTLEQGGYRGRRVVAGLSIPEVELHPLEIPEHGELQMAEKFSEAARWELERVGNMEANEAVSSYWRLPSSKTSRATAMGAIARSTDVDAADKLVQALGLDCERVDATACALSRVGSAVRRGSDVDRREVWSVLDIGQRMLRLVLSVGEVPVLVRSLGQGSRSWTEGIAESLGLSVEAAEVHKRDHGIAPANPEASPDASAEIAAMIYNILRSDLEGVVGEIERSYEYVMRCYPELPAGGLLLVGGGADLKGLCTYLSKQLGVEVRSLTEVGSTGIDEESPQSTQRKDEEGVTQGSTDTKSEIRDPKSEIHNPQTWAGVTSGVRESLNPYGCAIGLAIEPEPVE